MCRVVDGMMNRQFGVELEGYMNENKRHERFYVGEEGEVKTFKIEDDGSLHDQDADYTKCEECNNDGMAKEECDECGGTGEMPICGEDGEETDSYGSCDHCNNGYNLVKCKECDGEANIRMNEPMYGVEVVSPILRDTKFIHLVYDKMNKYGWSVGDGEEAGLHIHVDARDFTYIDFQKLIWLMTTVEPVIYSINDSYRYEESTYCLAMINSEVASGKLESIFKMDEFELGNHFESDEGVLFTNDRYYGLNLTAYEKHSTVEFRYFSPQTSPYRVCKYVELVTQLMDFVKNATLEQIQVISHKLYPCSFSQACDVLNDILELSFNLKDLKQNDIHDYTYVKIDANTIAGVYPLIVEQSEVV